MSYDSAINVVQTIAKDDEEKRSRITTLDQVYDSNPRDVCGTKYFLGILDGLTPNSKDILDKIFRIIGKGDPVQRLSRAIMNEHTFKTMVDNEEIYYYSGQKYVPRGEWLINEVAELMYPEITTHHRQEVVNHIKYRTGVHRSKFDADHDILNLQNGLLNIHTGEFKEHSPDHNSLVQLPIKYDPDAKCPAILEFLGKVLKPKDIFTALQFIGYCLFRTAKYEKGALLIGK